MTVVALFSGLAQGATLATAHLSALTSIAPFSLALAFSAGALTTLNPCGFALLPAYIAYVLRGEGEQPSTGPANRTWTYAWSQAARGGLLGVPLTAGFLLIFAVAGGTLALGGHALIHLFPWLALLVGFGLVALGGWMLVTKRSLEAPSLGNLPIFLRSLRRRFGTRQPHWTGESAADLAQKTRGQLAAAWTFGFGYGLSSLGCALPIFLLVVGSAITANDMSATLLTLAAYAAGMALTLLAAALAASALHDLIRHSVLPLLRWAQPLAALMLLAAGLYIVQFQLRSGLVFH